MHLCIKLNVMNTKTIFSAVAIIAYTLINVSCDRTLLDTNRGDLTVSLNLNGKHFQCTRVDNHHESPMRVAYYDEKFLDITARLKGGENSEDEAYLYLTINNDKPIETGKRYYLQYHTGSDEDRVAEPPVYIGGVGEYRATDGWINLRKIKKDKNREGYLIISGNFEFTAENADGDKIKVKKGTFDGLY